MKSIAIIKRDIKHFYQRWTRGWDDTELWSLDYTIAKFTLPRLKEFSIDPGCFPCDDFCDTPEKWQEILNDMIFGLSFVIDDFDGSIDYVNYDWERKSRGLKYFGEYFNALWN